MRTPTTLRVIREEHHSLKAMLQSMHLLIEQGPGHDKSKFFRALRAMLFYIDQYPERLHHPKETELLFPIVSARDPSVAQAIATLDLDHERSQHTVRDLQHQLLQWEFLGESERQVFVDAFEKYKCAYLEHMQLEERVIFPAAINHLTKQDWETVDVAFVANQDPLSGGHSANGIYAELFSRISQEAPAPIGLGDF